MDNEQEIAEVLEILKEYQSIPVVPFATFPVKKFLESKLKVLPWSYITDGYTYVVHVEPRNRHRNNKKLIFMAHTDHPGFVLKNNREGLAFGTVGVKRLQKKLQHQPVYLKVFSKEGQYIGRAQLLDISDNKIIKIKADFEIPINSVAQYDIEYYSVDKETISVYNADDGISVALLLNFLKHVKPSQYFDIYVVFNLYEEVHQIGSWHFFQENKINIVQEDIFINLECLKVENVPVPTNCKVSIPSANYEDGVILQLSNTGCLFGYKSNLPNKAALFVQKVARNNNSSLQTGVIKDSCDSRCITQFNLTPNIITLTIPNKFKHNDGYKHEIVPEVIYKKDIKNMQQLLENIAKASESDLKIDQKEAVNSVVYNLKKSDFVTNRALMQHKEQLNQRLESYYKRIVQRGYFYPETILQQIQKLIDSIRLHIMSLLQKFNLV